MLDLAQRLRKRSRLPDHPVQHSAASTLPTELLLEVLRHFVLSFPPNAAALRAASLVSKHWHTHGANDLLYDYIHLRSHEACILLDRTIGDRRSRGAMIRSLNLLPFPIHPSTFSEYENISDETGSIYRHWPDDGRSSRAVLRILRRTPNLTTLALKAVEFHHRRITFADLGRNIASSKLKTLSLSGNMSQLPSGTFLEPLLIFLRTMPCAQLDELLLCDYRMSARMSEWEIYTNKLPPIKKLWMSCFTCQEHRSTWSLQPCKLAAFLAGTLVEFHCYNRFDSPLNGASAVLSGHSWPNLTTVCIAGVLNSAQEPLDLSIFPNLRRLELGPKSFLDDPLLPHHAIIYPRQLETLVIIGDRITRALLLARRISLWIREKRGLEMPQLRNLCIKIECPRQWQLVYLWKMTIAALAFREGPSINVTAQIWIEPEHSVAFEHHPSKDGGSYDIFRPLFKKTQ